MAGSFSVTRSQATAIDWLVVVGLFVRGVLRGRRWVNAMLSSWCVFTSAVLVSSALVQTVACAWGTRLQPRRPHALSRDSTRAARKLLLREVLDTVRCTFVVSCMAAAPLVSFFDGDDRSGLRVSLEGTGWTVPTYAAAFCVGILAADAWTYAKHRALHSRALWAFHAPHHAFRNPSAFGGFAISPFEALLTFAPILWWDWTTHWLPLFVPCVLSFVTLNAYLHCGYALKTAEAILPRALLNSSAFHNVHHEKSNAHFGEISSFFDYACGTSPIYENGLAAGYEWHVARSRSTFHEKKREKGDDDEETEEDDGARA